MPLASMTGFARSDGGNDSRRWTWELRSVNGKGLDLRLRLPPGFERLEQPIRERVAARLTRGNVQASLSCEGRTAVPRFRVSDAVLAEVLVAMERIGAKIPVQPPTLDGLLSIRGVVEQEEETAADPVAQAAEDAPILAGLDAALADLLTMRTREGGALGGFLSARLDEIGTLVRAAEAQPARSPEAIRQKLAEQIAMLLDAAPALDPDRLHQEAVLLATKADVREEIDRIDAHIAGARALLTEGGPVGRRLDFLSQEFNREANTLCSKSSDIQLTRIGLEMKATIDQFREQVQNVE